MNRTTWRWTPIVLMVGVLVGAGVFGPTVARRIAYAVAEGEARARRGQLVKMSSQDTLSPLFRAVAKVWGILLSLIFLSRKESSE